LWKQVDYYAPEIVAAHGPACEETQPYKLDANLYSAVQQAAVSSVQVGSAVRIWAQYCVKMLEKVWVVVSKSFEGRIECLYIITSTSPSCYTGDRARMRCN
jgi:hypothetical protein